MKPYRPENWERQYSWDGQVVYGDYEAGAGAMLEALKSQGKFFATKDGFVSIGEEIIVPKHTRGYVVFIPDEE